LSVISEQINDDDDDDDDVTWLTIETPKASSGNGGRAVTLPSCTIHGI